jgi:uncharacterized protein with PIN domain
MKRSLESQPSEKARWRLFNTRDGKQLEDGLNAESDMRCPRCDGPIEAKGESRLKKQVPLDAFSFDLECGACKRYWSVVQHTERSARLLRMRRFVAALRSRHRKPKNPAADLTALA